MIALLILMALSALIAFGLWLIVFFTAKGHQNGRLRESDPDNHRYADLHDVEIVWGIVLTLIGSVALLITLALTVLVAIPTTHLGIERNFGVIDAGHSLDAGVHLKWPWTKVESYSYTPATISYDGMVKSASDQSLASGHADAIEAITADRVKTKVQPILTYNENPRLLTAFKAQFTANGYDDMDSAQQAITQAAVRDAVITRRWSDGSILNRQGLADDIAAALPVETKAYFERMGLTSADETPITWDAVQMGAIDPPDDLNDANTKAALASISANANAQLVRVPAGLSPDAYAKLLTSSAVKDAVRQGKPLSVVIGGAGVVASAPR